MIVNCFDELVRRVPKTSETFRSTTVAEVWCDDLPNRRHETPICRLFVFEDFSEFSLAGVPSAIFAVGGVEPAKFAAAQQSGTPLPGLHSSLWAPDREPTLKSAITVETTALLELLRR
jgi:hypothetical protein